MKYSMLIKCEKCGYDNFPQHRFCGMCAAELRVPGAAPPTPAPRRVPSAPASAAQEAAPRAVSGPSFLGLGNESADRRSVDYLLEDEPPPSHRGRYVWLLVLAWAVATASWHWRAELGGLAARVAGTSGQSNSSEAAPASSASAGAPVEKPGAGVGDQASGQGQTPAAAPVAGAASNAGDAVQPAQADQAQASNPPQPGDLGSAAGVAKADASGEAASPPAVTPPKMRTRPATASATVTISDVEAEGERYLYGNGVPENCGRARRNLLAAAQRANSKAQNVLGTMYATGHCATRDLPTAYRWFGRSLRQEPGNTRIEQDLKVLWNQMTPEERKLALRDER